MHVTTSPRVFISYSHDSGEHKGWVLQLATDLRASGADAILDQWDLSAGQNTASFMERSISESDRVLLVCSEEYVRKADGRVGGVGYEGLIVTTEIVANIETKKFLPIIRNNPGRQKMPKFLGPRKYIDFGNDENYKACLDELLRELHGAPAPAKPPLGPNPFSGSAPSQEPARTAGPTGVTPSGGLLVDEGWFAANEAIARTGLSKLNFKSSMELRFALHSPVGKSQIELLNAVTKSVIQTFGWPIGIVLQASEEDRPKPTVDGIRAEVSVAEKSFIGRPSYDYWALRQNGDFYLLQSLFEDDRDANAIFFDTRIVRVTESFLFAANLYESLAVPGDTKVSIRITHRGFEGRSLKSASPLRSVISRRPATAGISQSEVVEQVGQLRENVVENVRRVTEPLFMLFDFAQFAPRVYDEIATSFAKGHVV